MRVKSTLHEGKVDQWGEGQVDVNREESPSWQRGGYTCKREVNLGEGEVYLFQGEGRPCLQSSSSPPSPSPLSSFISWDACGRPTVRFAWHYFFIINANRQILEMFDMFCIPYQLKLSWLTIKCHVCHSWNYFYWLKLERACKMTGVWLE